MPSLTSKKTRQRRRKSYRRGNRYQYLVSQGRVSRVNRALVPFPKTRLVKLRYVTNIKLDAGAGATTSYGFRSNDCYDPDYSGTGNQPYYFDQLMQMYNQFVVVGSKITIMPFGATGVGHYTIVGLYGDSDTTARPATLVESMEAPNTKWIGVGNGDQNPRRLSLTYSAKKVHGKDVINNVDLIGTATASPTQQDFYRIFVGCPNSDTDPGTVSINVVIKYTVLLKDRIDPATS